MIHFIPDEYKAVYAGEHVQLLPKEFALFAFLYEHPERTFSRDELLEYVWGMEEPSDRTVDDHIYRLRKKLAGWAHLFSLNTVRGQGYKLTLLQRKINTNPLQLDEQFASDVNRMMTKYHGLGMGAALQLLFTHKEVLGLPGDPFYDIYVKFVGGDFRWIVETDSLSFWKKAGYLLCLHFIMHFDPNATLRLYDQIKERLDLVADKWIADIKMNIIFAHMEAGQIDRAITQSREMEPVINNLHSDSFTSIFLVKQMYLHLLNDEIDAAAGKLRECETLLTNNPIQRELGAMMIAKGIFLYHLGNIAGARKTLDEAMHIVRQTRFVPHLIHAVHTILFFLHKKRIIVDEEYEQKYSKLWEQLSEQYRFDETIKLIERQFKMNL
ncbi:MAG: winged helix-turn-helix domain-containing protein [Clostridia bacterium]